MAKYLKSIKVSGNDSQVSTCNGKPIKEITINGVTYTRDISKLDPVQCNVSSIYDSYTVNSTASESTYRNIRLTGFLGNVRDATVSSTLTSGSRANIDITCNITLPEELPDGTVTGGYGDIGIVTTGKADTFKGTISLNTVSRCASYDKVNNPSANYYSMVNIPFEIQRQMEEQDDWEPSGWPADGEIQGTAVGAMLVNPQLWSISSEELSQIIVALSDQFKDKFKDSSDGSYSDWKDYEAELIGMAIPSPESPIVLICSRYNDIGYNSLHELCMDLEAGVLNCYEQGVVYMFVDEDPVYIDTSSLWRASQSICWFNFFPGNVRRAYESFVHDEAYGIWSDRFNWETVVPEDYAAIGNYLDADIVDYTYESGNMEALEQGLLDAVDNARYFITPAVKYSPDVIKQVGADYPGFGPDSCVMQTLGVTLQEMQGMYDEFQAGCDYYFTQAESDLSQALVDSVANYCAGACYTEYPSVSGNATLALITQ